MPEPDDNSDNARGAKNRGAVARAERSAAALRANLKRRKAQGRSRAEATAGQGPASEAKD